MLLGTWSGKMQGEAWWPGRVALPAMQGRNAVGPPCDTEEAGLTAVRLL